MGCDLSRSERRAAQSEYAANDATSRIGRGSVGLDVLSQRDAAHFHLAVGCQAGEIDDGSAKLSGRPALLRGFDMRASRAVRRAADAAQRACQAKGRGRVAPSALSSYLLRELEAGSLDRAILEAQREFATA